MSTILQQGTATAKPRSRGPGLWHGLGRDFAYAARTLRKHPAFGLASVLILALGLGASAAVFEITYEVVFKPLPYPHAGRLVRVTALRLDGIAGSALAGPEYDELTKLPQVARAGGFEPAGITLFHSGAPLRLDGALVTGSLFPMLGVPALLGRSLGPADAQSGAPAVVVLSYAAWVSDFGADLHVIGRRVLLAVQPTSELTSRAPKARPFEILGVMPPRAKFPFPGQLWVPLARPQDSTYRGMMGKSLATIRQLDVYVRLRRGVGGAAFRDSLASAHPRVAQAFPGLAKWRYVETPLRDEVVGDYRGRLLLWLAASVCLLLLTCVTVSNLMVGRARSAAAEGAVRMALGATRADLVRQGLALGGTVAASAGVLGIGLAYAVTKLCAASPPPGLPRVQAITVSWPILGLLFCAAVLLGLLFSLAPAVQFASPDLLRRLQCPGGAQRAGAGTHRRRFWARSGAVAFEIALAFVLALGAILAAATLAKLGSSKLGYNTNGLVTASVSVGAGVCPNVARCSSFLDELVTRMQAAPGVRAAAAAGPLPLGAPFVSRVRAVRTGEPTGAPLVAQIVAVTPGYFRAMGLKIITGRGILTSDGRSSQPVAVVSDLLARQLFGQHPLGRSLSYMQQLRVVGVVRDVRIWPGAQPLPALYLPLAQARFLPHVGLIVRAARSTRTVAGELPAIAASFDRSTVLSRTEALNHQLAAFSAGPRYQETIFVLFGGLGMLLGLAGVYGLALYQAGERTGEFAVRTALGASRRGIVGLALARSLVVSCIGLAAGLACYLAAARSLKSLFYGAPGLPAGEISVVAAAVLAAAVLAALGPALHAATTPAMEVLREG